MSNNMSDYKQKNKTSSLKHAFLSAFVSTVIITDTIAQEHMGPGRPGKEAEIRNRGDEEHLSPHPFSS